MTACPDQVVVVDPGNYTPYYDANLCDALVKHGWEVHWVTSPHLFERVGAPRDVRITNAFFGAATAFGRRFGRHAFVRRALKAASYPAGLRSLDRFLASKAAGVLHIQWALLPPLDAAMWRRWRSRGWTIVYTAHDVAGLPGTTPQALIRSQRQLFRVADAVVAHSDHDLSTIIALGAPASRVIRTPQGTPGLFARPLLDQTTARAELHIPPDRPTILFFGFLKPYKGLEMLLSSLTRVRERIPDVLLLVAGQSLTDANRLNRSIANLGLSDHVRWDRGYVPASQVGTYFGAADVVTLPYLAASSSAVLLNAASHARPVVATAVGGLPEMVRDGTTGRLVPPGDSRAIADALVELLQNRERARAMGENARQYALANHNWACIGKMTSEAYKNAMRR